MDYKKYIKSQKARFLILKLLSFVPDKLMLSWQYRIKSGRNIHWEKPKRFTEFIQLYKLKYRNPLIQKCVDKLAVREYIESKGLSELMPRLLGVYKDAKEIDFDLLPEKFIIKTTNGSGGQNNFICRNLQEFAIDKALGKLNSWLKLKKINSGREWAYNGINEPKIIIEELLEDHENSDGEIDDYKILCFNGKPEVIIYDCDRFTGHKRNFYDINWNLLNVSSDCPNKTSRIVPPRNLDKMISFASSLSEDFPFVRVDLYNINGKIYFGELTFYPWSGYVNFTPDSFDFELGKLAPPLESFQQ